MSADKCKYFRPQYLVIVVNFQFILWCYIYSHHFIFVRIFLLFQMNVVWLCCLAQSFKAPLLKLENVWNSVSRFLQVECTYKSFCLPISLYVTRSESLIISLSVHCIVSSLIYFLHKLKMFTQQVINVFHSSNMKR